MFAKVRKEAAEEAWTGRSSSCRELCATEARMARCCRFDLVSLPRRPYTVHRKNFRVLNSEFIPKGVLFYLVLVRTSDRQKLVNHQSSQFISKEPLFCS